MDREKIIKKLQKYSKTLPKNEQFRCRHIYIVNNKIKVRLFNPKIKNYRACFLEEIKPGFRPFKKNNIKRPRSNKEIIELINKLGNRKDKRESYKFVSFDGVCPISGGKIVIIEHIISKTRKRFKYRHLIGYSNPFYKNQYKIVKNDKKIIELVNRLGKNKSRKESFTFAGFAGNATNGAIKVKIFNKYLNQYREIRYARLKDTNPFRKNFKRISPEEIAETVTQIGLSYTNKNEQFTFHSIKQRSSPLKINIQHTRTGDLHSAQYTHLRHGLNPFREKQELRERREVINLTRKLKKIKGINVFNEYYLSKKGNRIDILIQIPSSKPINLGIEVKHPKSNWTNRHLVDQVRRYTQSINLLFPKHSNKVLLCCKKGKYGITYLELFKTINKILKQKRI